MTPDRGADVLQAMADTLNLGRFKAFRWQMCEAINKRLDRMDLGYRLFDLEGVAGVGSYDPDRRVLARSPEEA